MSADASSRLAQWWVHGVGTLAPTRSRDEWSAAIATRALRWARRALRRWSADGQPQNAVELLAYARSIERDMPGLAADLRSAALRHGNVKG
jgi:hypothetical protein